MKANRSAIIQARFPRDVGHRTRGRGGLRVVPTAAEQFWPRDSGATGLPGARRFGNNPELVE